MSGNDGDFRGLALGVGDLHGGIVQALREHMAKSKEERNSATRAALQQLHGSEHLTSAEAEQLGSILDVVSGDEMSEADAAARVNEIHEDLKREDAGLLALAISSIAVDSTRNVALAAKEEGNGRVEFLAEFSDMSVGEADCAGGIIGATVGLGPGLLGLGPGAVLAGAAGGAAAGSLAVWLMA